MYAGCAGCVGGATFLLGGAGLAVYGLMSGLTVLTVAGAAVAVLGLLVGAVSGVVNNLGFGKDLADRMTRR